MEMKKIYYMIMAGLALTACSDEVESTFGNDALAVHFTANVGTASRSANSYIANGATVKISNGGKYFGYVAGDDGNLTPTDGDFIRWSSMSQGSMAITAYTPATDAASISSFTIAADQSSAAALAAADYATFDGTVSRLANSNNVSFELTRQLAQVNVNIASVDKRYTDTDDDKFTFDVTVFSPSTTVTVGADGVSGDGKALEVTPYSSSATTSTAIIAAGQADDAAKFLAVQVKKNGTAVGNPLIALGRPVLEAGNSYTLNLTVLYDEVSISSVQLTDWVTVDTIEGGEAEKEPIPDELVINLQDYSSEADVRSAIYDYYNKVEGDVHVSVVGTLNGWDFRDVLGINHYNVGRYINYGDNTFRITHLNLDGITDLTELPRECFRFATTLKQVSANQVITVDNYAFEYLYDLYEVNLSSAESIGGDVFSSDTSLTTINLPNAKTIDYYAFFSCTSLTTVSIPQATSFGGDIFYLANTENIDLTLNESLSANVSNNTWKYNDIVNNTTHTYTFKSITLVNVVNLQDYDSAEAVRDAIQNSTNVTIVGKINDWALTDVFGAYENGYWSIKNLNLDGITDLTGIPYNTFGSGISIEKLSATQVTYLYNYSCSLDKLKEVNLPSVEYVSNCAFAHCQSLTNISLPKAETIEIMGFYDCSSLTSVDLPNVNTLGYYVFRDCTSLASVYIPNATKFDSDIFLDCNTENIDLTLNESQRAYVDMTTYTWFCNQDSYTFKSISFE
jgi:hypothetical protein